MQSEWTNGDVPIIVATIAFGMGGCTAAAALCPCGLWGAARLPQRAWEKRVSKRLDHMHFAACQLRLPARRHQQVGCALCVPQLAAQEPGGLPAGAGAK